MTVDSMSTADYIAAAKLIEQRAMVAGQRGSALLWRALSHLRARWIRGGAVDDILALSCPRCGRLVPGPACRRRTCR
jgi:hypothetical protein